MRLGRRGQGGEGCELVGHGVGGGVQGSAGRVGEHEVVHGDVEGLGDADDVVQAGGDLAGFVVADLGDVDADGVGQGLLGRAAALRRLVRWWAESVAARRQGHSVEATAGLIGPVGVGGEGRARGGDAQGVDGGGSGGDRVWDQGGLVGYGDRGVTRPR